MRRAPKIALAALTWAAALAASPARAQFRTTPMVVPAPGSGSMVIAQPFGLSTADSDLLALFPTAGTSWIRRHHDLIASAPAPVAQPPFFIWARAGRLAPLASDALPDVAYCSSILGTNELQIAFGHQPAVLAFYPSAPLNGRQTPPTFTFAHLLQRSDFLVMPWETGASYSTAGLVYALDFDPATAAMSQRGFPVPARTQRIEPDEVLPMRIGANARAQGIDDLYLLGQGSVTLFENLSPPAATTLGEIQLGQGFRIGGSIADGVTATWLPNGVSPINAQGAAPLDVDGDGTLDLVVSLSWFNRYSAHVPGHLLWIRGTGVLADFATAAYWTDLNGHPDLMLSDPVVARPLLVEGEPAVALWDRGLDQVLVIRAGTTPGRFRVWRGEAGGHRVTDVFLADLVGSSAPDLVANAALDFEPAYPQARPSVLVYPDVGDASPVIAWAAGSPGAPERGEDHPMAVVASDADGAFSVDWIVGDPWLDPVVGNGSSYFRAGSDLCGVPPQTLPVTVRAVDLLGVWAEIDATLEVSETPPRIAVSGAVPPDRLVLPPGGATFAVEGAAWTHCPVSFAWGASTWPAGATVTVDSGAGWTRLSVVLPEASYPEVLAGTPTVSLTATDPALPSGVTATLPLAIDATGLVAAEHSSDLSTLADGQVAVLRTTLRSRVGVALPSVRVVHLLDGLSPAGPARVTGAAIAETEAGGREVVLDSLPASGAEVVVELPVGSAGARHASAVEVRSAGGHLLTPAAAVPGDSAPLPGCGCGSSGSGAGALAALLVALMRRRHGDDHPH